MWWAALAGAILGGIAGGASVINNSDKEQQRIRNQRNLAIDAYNLQRAYSDDSYNLERNVSLENLGIQKNRLAEAFATDITAFNMGAENQARQNQTARLSMADGIGEALAAQGASGVTGSNALAMRISAAENQFTNQIDFQNRADFLALGNMSRQYTNSFHDIGREIDSWNPGGYRAQAKSLSDTYAANMHGLQMHGFDLATEDAQWTWLDLLAGSLGGSTTGANLGYSIGDYVDQNQWKKPDTKAG